MSEEVVYGIDTPADAADRLMLLHIRKDWLELERSLMTGKWFDYRFMNPVQATYLYAHEFKKVYRRMFRTNIDHERALYVTPLKENMFDSPKQTISGLWRGRQVADAMGMPYALYLERAFHWVLRYWKQRHLPRPQQLYSDLVTDRAAIDWSAAQGDRLFCSRHENYQNQRYCGLDSQNAHHEWLFEQADRRGNSTAIFASLMFEERLLPIDKVQSRVGEDVFAQIMQRANSYN